jgi:hypothetical protein
MSNIQIKDLIYFDFNKTASIYSQFEGGLRERLSITEDKTKERAGGVKVKVPSIAEASFGMEYVNATSIIESKLLHHDMLNKVEEKLTQLGLIVNLNKEIISSVSSPEDIRTAIGNKPYVIANGWGIIEDYNHILSITQEFNNIIEFIAKCGIESVKNSPEYLELQQKLEEKQKEIKGIADRNQRAIEKNKLNAIEKNLESILISKVSPVDEWLIKGIQKFIKVFVPNRINFRIYPFESCPSFQVICNLKHECFVDQDLEHLLYGYSNRPNIPLAVFGLITSLPSNIETRFDPMAEFETEEKLSEKMIVEKAFRNLFSSMDQMEDFVRYSRYPNITIHPLAVFRQLH